MSTQNDGGPAFPKFWTEEVDPDGRLYQFSSGGMSLRDYFAAAALQGLVARGPANKETYVEWAWEYADAMLAERNKTK